ncbi:hypothetical protein [Lacinutrix cladophorae]
MTKEFEFPVYLTVLGIFVYIFFVRSQIRKLFSDWTRKEDVIGLLEFSDNALIIDNSTLNEKIRFTDIESIYLHYNYVQGKQYAARDIIHNGLAEIILKTKNNKQKSFKFLIENKNQITDLKPIWRELYLLGVFIREKMGKYEVKTIMFDADLTDKKIKKLKTELNIDSFY